VYAVEISERGVEEASKKGIKAFRLDVDVEDLPFKDEFFDAVFAGEVMEHLFDPDHFFRRGLQGLEAQRHSNTYHT